MTTDNEGTLMEISSAFNSGVQGLQKARETANQAAEDIVASTALATEQENIARNAETNKVNNQANTNQIPDLNQSIVNLKVAEFQAKASTEVIKSADDALGTLLDVTA